MKKLLSVILALVMLLSVIPFSSASAKLSTEGQECVYAYIRLFCYADYVVYDDYIASALINDIAHEIIAEVNSLDLKCGMYYEDLNDSKNAEDVAVMTEKFLSGVEKVETLIAENNIGIVVDGYECYKTCGILGLLYSEEELNGISKVLENEKYAKMYSEAEALVSEAFNYLHEGRDGNIAVTQAEFDAIWKQATPVLDMVYNCLDGNHLYGEYVSNNDATEEADGTKTRVCDFCGAEDTVTDEGSRLGSEEKPLSFIEKILAFFRNLFAKIFGIFG